jgi:hypothetical protein
MESWIARRLAVGSIALLGVSGRIGLIVQPREMLREEATARITISGAGVVCELSDTFGKIFRRCANSNEVLDAACGPIREPIVEVVVVPERSVRPEGVKVRT